MENKMNFAFMLSLKEIAMRRVAINLWNHPDTLVSIENFCEGSPNYTIYSEKWREAVENKVINNLSKLEIPSALSKQLLLVLPPIGLQILRWKVFHENFLTEPYAESVRVELCAPVLEKLRWTAAGLIDYRLTAEELLKSNMFHIEDYYRLACLYCLKDCIPPLWNELPKQVKRQFMNRKNISYIASSDLPYIWPYILRGEQSKLDKLMRGRTRDQTSFNQMASAESARKGNKFATEYFFQNLPNDEKSVFDITKQTLLFLSVRPHPINAPVDFPPENCGNVLCYLLSLMNYEQQVEIIRSHPITVLTCFLEWPWQDVFLKIADLVCGFFSKVQHFELFISMSVFYSHSNYSNPRCFQEFYTRSSIDLKKDLIEFECRLGQFFPIFFDNQDSETIEIVMRNSDSADRVRLVSSEKILKLFYDVISKGRSEMMEVCLREARLTDEDRKRLIEAFAEFIKRAKSREIEKNKEVWMKFLQILFQK